MAHHRRPDCSRPPRATAALRLGATGVATLLILGGVAATGCAGDDDAGTTALQLDPNLRGDGVAAGSSDAATADGGAGGGDAATDEGVSGGGSDGTAGGGDGAQTDGGPGAADGGAQDGGSGATIDAQPQLQPKLEVRLDGVPSLVQSFWINPNPQADNSVLKIKVELENKGEAPLHITNLAFASETPQIALDWYDPEPQAGDYPVELQPFQTLTLAAVWTTTPKLEGQAIAVLTIASDDPKQPNLQATFATPCTDAKAVLQPTQVTIENAGPFLGKVGCTTLQNLGCKPLTVAEVVLQTDDGSWQLVQPPAPGTTIGVYGGGDNPASAPVKLPICARFEPATEVTQAAPVTVKVFTQGGSAQSATATFQPVWTPPSSYSLACGGAQRFDFTGKAPGAKATCKLQNHGPAPLLVADLKLQADDGAVTTDQLALSFAAAILQGAPQQAPYTLQPGGVAELQVHWLANASPPGASVRLVLHQQGDVDELWLPIVTGACDEARLVYGPAPPTFAATAGAAVQVELTLANQSCAPLTIVEGCVTGFQVSQQDACTTGGPSAEFSVVAGQLSQTIAPWGLAKLKVRFAPISQSGEPHYGQLHQFWCRGVATGGLCSGKVEKLSIPLEGTSKPGLKGPVATAKPLAKAALGKTLTLAAQVQKGNLPIAIAGAFRWLVTSRPAGSAVWFDAEATDGAARDVTLDLPGAYTFALRVLSATPGDLVSQIGSAPLTFEVQAAP